MFVIDSQSGQIRLGRKPLDSERAHQWTLNVSATENEIGIGKLQQKQKYAAFTTVEFFILGISLIFLIGFLGENLS